MVYSKKRWGAMTVQAKISERSKKIVREIVHETGESQIAVIEHAVLAYHREWRMQKINEAYAKLKQNKNSWKEELKERSILDKTSDDGLEDV
jgi:molybdopterin synthase catalytic subunit